MKKELRSLGRQYKADPVFRTHVSLYLSLAINLLFVAINLLSYLLYRSMWFIVLAVYYSTLAGMRFVLLRFMRGGGLGRDRLGELKSARFCGFILLVMNFALFGAVLMILYVNKGFSYHGTLIYAVAAYTFYYVVHAAINLFKFRIYNSPVLSAAGVITLSAALVSMLALETALLSRFGAEMSAADKWWMIALTGAGIGIAVIVMSGRIITQTTKEIRSYSHERAKK